MIKGLLKRMNSKKNKLTLAILGEVNAGKTTLANRMSNDFGGQPLGNESPIPHETREIVSENIIMASEGNRLNISVMDTPGLASKVDYREFVESHGMTRKEAIIRAKEATKGIIKAIQCLNQIDAAVIVVDSSKQPFDQVNWTIIGNLKERNIPIIVAANKADLPQTDTEFVDEIFSEESERVVPLSALTGENMDALYSAIIDIA